MVCQDSQGGGGGLHEIDGIIHELTCKFSCILKLAQYIHIIQAYQVYHGILGSWEKLLSEILQTSSARRATLRDTSWARLTTEQTSWNFMESQLDLESKTEPSLGRHQTTWGGVPHIKHMYWEGGIQHILSRWVEQLGWGKTNCSPNQHTW